MKQEGCTNLDNCKSKWYFESLPAKILSLHVNTGLTRFEEWESEALNSLATEYLSSLGYKEEIIKKTITEMKAILLKEHLTLSPPLGPEQSDAVFLYVPSLELFVPYWDD